MKSNDVIQLAKSSLVNLKGHEFNILNIEKPPSLVFAANLSKIVSKLSPIIGNLIELSIVDFLNQHGGFPDDCKWVRQDPGFPDTILKGSIDPTPGFEVKAWFPFATEITARFKDSQNHFTHDNTHVVLLAWVPSKMIYGKPYILETCVVSAKSIAKSRDDHYHCPPHYVVLEPEDTSARTPNLQQTNTNGYKWQGTVAQLEEAKQIVSTWGPDGEKYLPSKEYQTVLKNLIARFPYRLDTNFAKMDRIVNNEIEAFKTKVMEMELEGMAVSEWGKILMGRRGEAKLHQALVQNLGIR